MLEVHVACMCNVRMALIGCMSNSRKVRRYFACLMEERRQYCLSNGRKAPKTRQFVMGLVLEDWHLDVSGANSLLI